MSFIDDLFIINNGNTAGTFGGVNVAGTGNIVNLAQHRRS